MRRPMKRVDFCRGKKVEVCSKEDGFVGSYYEATLVSHLPNGLCVVRYTNLLEDDESQPLTETLYQKELRPLPPRVQGSAFSLYQKVDVFDNDGWWVGEITGRRISDSHYYVYFTTTNEEIAYPYSQIRVHHDWVNGDWLLSN
ncbi:protein AGENET DOMAIN (AGD)-CONTAINING P1-like [Gastrolobium bilobum]|uniref:protein AGENET DOMAIN (AGD)-CONTAINING P1-like n=1 Tax=Gastrolobium bilobum TaxID=150636 RepID=UPI002AB30DCF|nr:protein AGENET DOMAIN (AGD)-CONTAINING P1-like [Gastrolobium bilobum]